MPLLAPVSTATLSTSSRSIAPLQHRAGRDETARKHSAGPGRGAIARDNLPRNSRLHGTRFVALAGVVSQAPAGSGAARRLAGGALAERPQHAVAIDARRVAVGPDGGQAVTTDLLQIHHPRLLLTEHLELRQHAGQVALAGALRAGAGPAQRLEVVDGLVTIAPLDAHQPLVHVDFDVERLQAIGVLHRGSLLALS